MPWRLEIHLDWQRLPKEETPSVQASSPYVRHLLKNLGFLKQDSSIENPQRTNASLTNKIKRWRQTGKYQNNSLIQIYFHTIRRSCWAWWALRAALRSSRPTPRSPSSTTLRLDLSSSRPPQTPKTQTQKQTQTYPKISSIDLYETTLFTFMS